MLYARFLTFMHESCKDLRIISHLFFCVILYWPFFFVWLLVSFWFKIFFFSFSFATTVQCDCTAAKCAREIFACKMKPIEDDQMFCIFFIARLFFIFIYQLVASFFQSLFYFVCWIGDFFSFFVSYFYSACNARIDRCVQCTLFFVFCS